MNIFILGFVSIILIGLLYYLFVNQTGRMFRIGMMVTMRTMYRWLHPKKRAMPTSLEESRKIFHASEDEEK